MISYTKAFWGTVFISVLFMVACITINIYFPAEKVESAAKEIVNEIRGTVENNEKQSLLLKTFLALSCSYAFADEITEVSNPTIRALKERMKTRFAQMKPYYHKGMLNEGDDGNVIIKSTEGLGLKETRDLKNFVSAENDDRQTLYEEVAKALKIDAVQINQVAEIFAKEWQRSLK
jgi:hypothetical protein